MKHMSGKVGHSRCDNIASVDEELYLELVNVEANPLREMPLAGMNEPQKRRVRQLAFTLTMHTKDRAFMITKLSNPANGFEIWRRFLEEWEPAHRGRYRAMLMQFLQFPFVGDRGQALEEWERLVRQYDTIKAAILAHNPQDPEWRRHVGLNATRLQGYDALKSESKTMHQAYRQWSIADGKDTTPMEVDALMKGKGKNKDKAKEGTSDTSNMKCFFCKEKGHARKDCLKFSAWLAEKKTVGHEQSASSTKEDGWIFALEHEHEELCELIMIDSGASVHVCPLDLGQEKGPHKSSKTRPLLTASGAEMIQHGMRQVSYDTEVGKITTDYRVLDVRRPIRSLGSMLDSGWDVHFRKNRCWISKDDGKELDMIRNGGVFFVAARPSKSSSRESKHAGTQSYDSSRGRASGTGKGSRCRSNVGRRWAVRIKVPTGLAMPSAEERALHEASGHVPYRSWCQWCIAARAADKPHLRGQQPDTDEAAPRIEFYFADLGREEDQVLPIPSINAVDVGSESLSATLCPTKAPSEHPVETILAFVEALGHTVVMLHSDQEPVWVQLLKAVQNRRVKRTLVRHGPRASHQSQGRIENANRVINGVCRAMWLSLEDLLREKLPSDSILVAWLIRHEARCLTRFHVKNDGRTAFVCDFGKAYTSQVLPFGEGVMYM